MAKEIDYNYKGYKAKFDKRHKAYTFYLHNDKDKDIIKWLDDQENRSEAIREALREIRQ